MGGIVSRAVESAQSTARSASPSAPDLSAAADDIETSAELWEDEMDDMSIMKTVQMIGGAVIGIAVITIVVNQVLTTNAVTNTSGPFDGVIDSLGTTGVSAMTLLVIGLLVAAASQLMSFFRGGF